MRVNYLALSIYDYENYRESEKNIFYMKLFIRDNFNLSWFDNRRQKSYSDGSTYAVYIMEYRFRKWEKQFPSERSPET